MNPPGQIAQAQIQQYNPTRLAIQERIKMLESEINGITVQISDLKKVLPLFPDPFTFQSMGNSIISAKNHGGNI